MATRISVTARNAGCTAKTGLLDAGTGPGTVKVYSGTQPATPETAASGTLLATFTLADPAFGTVSVGVQTLAGTPISSTAAATGTAGYFRAADSDGNAVFDGSVGTSGAQLNLNSTSIVSGGAVQITSGTATEPGA